MKITIIAGARPNFMKIAPLIKAIRNAQEHGVDIHSRLIYTGTETDESLESTLFNDLDISSPEAYLNVDSNDFFERLAGIITAFAHELEQHPADIVMVVDDFTPTMACSIVARKKGIKVAHLVAGTRSFDMNMPKEVNRMITDGLSDILFTAGMVANRNLNQTGTNQKQVHFVGNILMDTLRYNYSRFKEPDFFHTLGLRPKEYLLLTINRHSLLKEEDTLRELLNSLLSHTTLPIVVPVHQYVKERIQSLQISSERMHLLPPQPYLSFGYLLSHSNTIVTDSGNIAEEATFLNIPCITLNNYAEHPETITHGTNHLVGDNPQALADALDALHAGKWKKGQLPERWDGRTAERIIQTLLKEFTE